MIPRAPLEIICFGVLWSTNGLWERDFTSLPLSMTVQKWCSTTFWTQNKRLENNWINSSIMRKYNWENSWTKFDQIMVENILKNIGNLLRGNRNFAGNYCNKYTTETCVTERTSPTVFKKEKSIRTEREVIFESWADAIVTSPYLRNRTPKEPGGWKTPIEWFNGKKASISIGRTIGFHAALFIPS